LDIGENKLDEALTLDKFASMISELDSIQELQEKLLGNPRPNVMNWMSELLDVLHEKEEQLLSTYSLIPDQQGMFRKKMDLYRDEDIDEELKDILKDQMPKPINWR